MKNRSYNQLLRRKWKTLLVITGLIYISYQLLFFRQLSSVFKNYNLEKGTHEKQLSFYKADDENMFQCIESGEKIPYNRLNDNYCDCLDGTDEPGTNACPNGLFYCKYQQKILDRSIKNFIPSSMVNDGICDCCDGSDEWANNILHFRLSDSKQRELNRFQTPCPNICPKE